MSAIKVDQVTKIYRLFDRPIDRLKESLNPFHKEYHKKFYALNEISFQVEQGPCMGIIGTNGSGKSTIFKIINRVNEPTHRHYHRAGDGFGAGVRPFGAGRRV